MSESTSATQPIPSNAPKADSGQAAPAVDAKATASANAQAQAAAPADGKKPEEANGNNNANNPIEGNKEVKYDLKLPEGSQLGADAVEKISSFAKEKGLSNEQAQAILEHEDEAVSSFAEYQKQQYEQTRNAWVEEVKNNKEYGGEKLNESLAHAKRVLEKYDPTGALRKALNDTGYGDFPPLVEFFVKLGRSSSEDKLVTSGTQGTGNKSIEDIFYGNKEK